MKEQEQKLMGYIIYEAMVLEYGFKGVQHTTVHSPKISWRKKVYESIESAKEALAHMESHSHRHGVIIPIYAKREDLSRVSEKYKELKNINKIK